MEKSFLINSLTLTELFLANLFKEEILERVFLIIMDLAALSHQGSLKMRVSK
jgi:hypothetical protein